MHQVLQEAANLLPLFAQLLPELCPQDLRTPERRPAEGLGWHRDIGMLIDGHLTHVSSLPNGDLWTY